MNREDEEFRDTLELLREAHREPIAEAHYAAVRARVLSQLAERRRPQRIWVYGLAAAAVLAIFVGWIHWPARVPPQPAPVHSGQPLAIREAPARAPAATAGRRQRIARRPESAAYRVVGPPPIHPPLVVKLVTNDPNVVIYWITGE